MRTVDLTPLYRVGVGFDRLANIVDAMVANDQNQGYPPYNIVMTGETSYRITLAVAGFDQADLDITSNNGDLIVKGAKQERDQASDGVTFLHRGIAERAFERRFKLADHVRVTGAELENGLLHIELVREVPEALRARKIEIDTSGARTSRIAAE